MDNIPTAANKLMDLKTYFKWVKNSDNKDALNGYALWEDIPQVMIEFTKLHVEAALKAAIGEAPLHCSDGIRNCYPLSNIK